ncbi:MAG: 6-bladed beta-propeller [Geopsychrobacter sp.]|nr:6-bladed beta-propeller [Geopsychrobacter sp.]
MQNGSIRSNRNTRSRNLRNSIHLCRWCFILVGICLLISCSPALSPLSITDPEMTQVWPNPPDTPRIKLLRSFGGAADLADKQNNKNRLFRWLTGEMADKMPLVAPYGIATDGNGVIWITDPGAHAVHVLNLKKRKFSFWSMAGGDFFSSPTGICYDAAKGRIYVSDSLLKKIFILSPQGDFLGQILPTLAFKRPAGLALDLQGNLLVADVLGGKIRRFTGDGVELSSLGSPTTPDGLFNRPIGLAVDAKGLIYVIDSLNFRIEVIASDGKAISSIGKLGDQPGDLSRPRGVTVDKSGHIYVADAAFDNIQIFNLKGELLLVFGGDGKHRLSMPASLVSDQQDRIYVVDSFNHQIKIYKFLDGEN